MTRPRVVAPDEDVDVELDPQNMEDDLLLSMIEENADEEESNSKPGRVRPTKKDKLGKMAMKAARQSRAAKAGGKGGKLVRGKGGKPIRSRVGNLASHWPGSKGARPLCPAYNSKKGCRKRKCRGMDHACGYIIADDGSICGRKDCSYRAHPE